MTWFVKKPKVVERESLCRSCRHAHIVRGYGDGEERVYCTFATPVHTVPFAVRFCTGFCDRDVPTAAELEKAYHC
jgi:hypothetical protein